MVKFIDSKQSFEIIFITITPSLFFPMLLTKKKMKRKTYQQFEKKTRFMKLFMLSVSTEINIRFPFVKLRII